MGKWAAKEKKKKKQTVTFVLPAIKGYPFAYLRSSSYQTHAGQFFSLITAIYPKNFTEPVLYMESHCSTPFVKEIEMISVV
jgi:hypothetical protein